MYFIQQKVSKGIDPPQVLSPDMVPPSERGTPGPDSSGSLGSGEFTGVKELDDISQEIAQLQSHGQSQTPHFMLSEADGSCLSRLLGAMLSKLVISKQVQPDKAEGILRMLGQRPRAWAGLRIRTGRPRMEGSSVMQGEKYSLEQDIREKEEAIRQKTSEVQIINCSLPINGRMRPPHIPDSHS
ncbi:hypothetical protein P7K49_033506 [Saguinus oedipus]|uniref:Uncharacterized protein n=1 Tax=Saguinus oedipus TaxID=9490 RepID=A0ABQ9TS53_SAGOE|nr:hypothetical protein P7K49_033506 [Saguinus oedipus]